MRRHEALGRLAYEQTVFFLRAVRVHLCQGTLQREQVNDE